MTNTISFSAQKRDTFGTSSSREARRQGYIPAIMYGDKVENEGFNIPFQEFCKHYYNGSIQTKLIELNFGDKNLNAIIKSIQKDKVTDDPIHIDFQRVSEDTIIRVMVNVRIIGDDKSPGLKKNGVLNIMKRAIPFYCHPAEIPKHIDVDVSKMEIGQTIHINDISLPTNSAVVDKSNFAVVSLTGRHDQEEKAQNTEA